MLTRKERLYAIGKSIYFGVLPSWFYEKKCHYANDGEGYTLNGYLDHLEMNIRIIYFLIRCKEHECTHEFHKMKVKKWVRWQYK